MARARRTYPLQGTLLTVCALGLLVLTVYAWSRQPTATLVAHLPENGVFSHDFDDGSALEWWRLAATIRGSEDERGDWTLYEGDDLIGYRLQWKADTKTWTMLRIGPGPGLLARGVLEEPPKALEWMRHRNQLTLTVDGSIVCRIIDLLAHQPGRSWGLDFSGVPPRIQLDLHDDSYQAPPAPFTSGIEDRSTDLHAELAKERDPITILENTIQDMLTTRDGLDNARVFFAARLANGIEGYPEDVRQQMLAWVMWAAATATIQNRNDFDAAFLRTIIDQLRMTAASGNAIPQIPGFFHNLSLQAAGRARDLPMGAAPAERFVRKREQLLQTVASLSGNDPDTWIHEDPSEAMERQFCEALARGLVGERPPATPAEAPRWMVDRWRGVSGTNPIELPLTAIPVADPPRPWVRGTLDELLTLADLRPASAVRLRARTLAAVTNSRMDDLKAALSDTEVPHRESLLTSSILATRGIVDPVAALRALTSKSEGRLSIAERDPLAYAIYHLLLHRQLRDANTGVDVLGAELPPALTPHERLLSGAEEATTIAFGDPTATLRPPEALAAALVMQEVQGLEPDWSLLTALPSMVLPLSLLEPGERTQPEPPSGAGDQP